MWPHTRLPVKHNPENASLCFIRIPDQPILSRHGRGAYSIFAALRYHSCYAKVVAQEFHSVWEDLRLPDLCSRDVDGPISGFEQMLCYHLCSALALITSLVYK